MKVFIGVILSIFVLSIVTIRTVQTISLKQNCTGYLKRAADANDVISAKEQLQLAIAYLEEHNMTSGYTSVLYNTPDEDIKFWYNNLKICEAELLKIDNNSSPLEQTNLLMKLRETLLDNGRNGEHLTIPAGLARYPNNLLWGLMSILSIIAFIVLLVYIIRILEIQFNITLD